MLHRMKLLAYLAMGARLPYLTLTITSSNVPFFFNSTIELKYKSVQLYHRLWFNSVRLLRLKSPSINK